MGVAGVTMQTFRQLPELVYWSVLMFMMVAKFYQQIGQNAKLSEQPKLSTIKESMAFILVTADKEEEAKIGDKIAWENQDGISLMQR